MAATTLEFQEEGGAWVAEYNSQGDAVVQVARSKAGGLSVKAGLDGMEPKDIFGLSEYEAGTNTIFAVQVPAGVKVRIESGSEVTAAKILQEG